MVFDHKGELSHHHMGGQWHGGDKKRALELASVGRYKFANPAAP